MIKEQFRVLYWIEKEWNSRGIQINVVAVLEGSRPCFLTPTSTPTPHPHILTRIY